MDKLNWKIVLTITLGLVGFAIFCLVYHNRTGELLVSPFLFGSVMEYIVWHGHVETHVLLPCFSISKPCNGNDRSC